MAIENLTVEWTDPSAKTSEIVRYDLANNLGLFYGPNLITVLSDRSNSPSWLNLPTGSRVSSNLSDNLPRQEKNHNFHHILLQPGQFNLNVFLPGGDFARVAGTNTGRLSDLFRYARPVLPSRRQHRPSTT